MLDSALLTAGAYFLGATPTAYIVARYARGIDIRAVGSGNVGAVNTFKEAGVRPGLAVLLADIAKGAIVMALILALDLGPEAAFAAALAVTLGHNFSAFMRLRGGKGVAVVFGLSVVIFPLITVLSLIALPIVWRLTRSIVWAFLATFLVLNVLTVATGQAADAVGLCFTLSLIVIATHLWRNRADVLRALKQHDFAGMGKIE